MDAAEVIVHHVKRDRRLVIFELLAERIGETGEAALPYLAAVLEPGVDNLSAVVSIWVLAQLWVAVLAGNFARTTKFW